MRTDGDERATGAEGQRHRPQLPQDRHLQVRAGAGEEHDVDDAAQTLDAVQELFTLQRQVLHDEAGHEERQERLELQVVQHLREAEAEQQEHEQERAIDEA